MKISLILCLCVVSIGCSRSFRNYELDDHSFTAADLQTVQERTGIQLPTGSRGLNLYYNQPQFHPSFIAKIEIPTNTIDSVARQMERIPNEDYHFTNSISEKMSWWNPSNSEGAIKRQFVLTHSGFVDIQICKETNRWLFYAYWDAD